ncbi:MAG: DUF2087 domain-containing protein [Defluviitaleaceae bacterium]|nr:DUF2087 domain-containing protein [Defluviitaleaceae bacterium]
MEKNLNKYFKDGKLLMIPKKQTVKLEIFAFFHHLFESDKSYHESEINNIIKEYYADYAIIRRYLVDYKFLNRDEAGIVYKKIER